MTVAAAELYERCCQHARQAALLASIDAVLGWDERTMLPTAAGEYRAEQISALAGMIHERWVDRAFGETLEDLATRDAEWPADSAKAANIRELKRSRDKRVKLPKPLVEELSRLSVVGQQTWVEARKANNFGRFAPILKRTLELKREQADAIGYTDCRYDALLDDYEPDALTRDVARTLAALRDELAPFVAAIGQSSRRPDRSILARHYPQAAQQQFAEDAARQIGFDFARGRLDVTAHPFCTTLGPHDCRITTRYDERDFGNAFFSVLHEAGHGLYEQGLPPEQFGLPAGEALSMGIHESQSRLWENLVGRSRAYWERMFPLAQRAFPDSLGQVDLTTFHFAVNEVRPSLIRTESDEATYNLHIIVRFELERALLDGDLPVGDLPGAWNERYRKYVGIDVPSDADGVLQDVHWSAGLIGYFPTYSLGNLAAAQLYARADRELGGIDALLMHGEYQPLLDWLRDKVHRHGKRISADALLRQATGEPLGHSALMTYLRGKFGPLYGLKS